MPTKIVVSANPTPEDRVAISAPLSKFNLENGPPPNFWNIALLLQDDEGSSIGGLWGRAAYDWLFIEAVAVPASLRRIGWGRALMLKAEQTAIEHSSIGIWLNTLAFQALPFYEKLGYQLFGQIDDQPRGGTHYFLQKRLI